MPLDINSIVPQVVIDRIVLDTSHAIESKNDSSLTVAEANFINSQTNKVTRVGRPTDVSKKSNDSLPFLVTVNFVIKQKVDAGQLSVWFEEASNQSFTKYFKLRILASTDEALTNFILESPSFIDIRSSSVDFMSKDIELSSYFTDKLLLERYIVELPDGSREYDIPVVFRVNFKSSTIRHLSLFSSCYLDVAQMSKDFNMAMDSSIPSIQGKVNSEIIIRDFDTVDESYLFLDEFGMPWEGLVTKKIDKVEIKKGDTVVDVVTTTKYVAGDGSDTTNVKYLTLNQIPNHKVQDFRVKTELEKNILDFSILENEINPKIPNVSPQSLIISSTISPKKAYVSNLYLTGDKLGRARYLFGINVLDFAKENAFYGKLFKDNNIELMNFIKITSMKIKRVRVSPHKDDIKNEFGYAPFNSDDPCDLIGISNEKDPNQFSVGKLKNGTLREVDLDVENGMRFFTGVDHDMGSVTFGLYQYGVEVEFEDMTLDFLKDRINILLNAYEGLKDYNSDGSKINNFDASVGRFILPFITQQENYYKSKPESSPWSRVVSAYLGVLDLLVDKLDTEKYSKALLTFIHPRTGSLDGISTVLKLCEDLLMKLGQVTDISSTASLRSKIKSTGTIPSSTIRTRAEVLGGGRKLRIEKYFDSVFDSDLPKNTGYDYLSSDGIEQEPNDDGLLVVSSVKFEQRTNEETIKYFKAVDIDINLKTSTKQYTVDDKILNSKYRFLTPSFVELKGGESISMKNRGTGLLGSKQYESFLSQVMNFNYMKKSPRIPVRQSAPNQASNLVVQDQVTKNNLANVAFAAGIMLNNEVPVISMSRVKATDVVGLSSKFAGENIAKEQSMPGGTKTNPEPNATVNPNAIFLSLLMPEMVTGVHKFSPTAIKQNTNTINNFNLNSKNNVVDRLANAKIKDLPNQLKSLMVSSVNSDATRFNFIAEQSDVVKNPKKSLGFKMNYNMINEVEVFSGFVGTEKDDEGNIRKLVKNPVWVKLTPEKFTEASNKNLFCRMRRYENKDMGVEIQNGLELPTYNEYFILSPEAHLNITTKFQRPANAKILEVQNKVQQVEKNIFNAATMNMQHANSLITTIIAKKPIPELESKTISSNVASRIVGRK